MKKLRTSLLLVLLVWSSGFLLAQPSRFRTRDETDRSQTRGGADRFRSRGESDRFRSRGESDRSRSRGESDRYRPGGESDRSRPGMAATPSQPSAEATSSRPNPETGSLRPNPEAAPSRPNPEAASSRTEGDRSSGPILDSFRIIADRNIFSATRRAGRMDAPTTRPTVQADQIFLTGAFILTTGSAQQYVAFFEGSRPEYNVSRKLGDSIVGYQIAEIRTGGVRLAQNNEQIVIPVSCGLTRQGEGKWQVTSEGSLSGRPEPPPSLSTSSRASSGAASSSSSGPPSDILKKLMERRRQQESGK